MPKIVIAPQEFKVASAPSKSRGRSKSAFYAPFLMQIRYLPLWLMAETAPCSRWWIRPAAA